MEETKSDFSKDNGIVQKMDALHNNLMKKCGNDSTIVFKLVTFVTKELLYENGTYDENDPFIQLINSL